MQIISIIEALSTHLYNLIKAHITAYKSLIVSIKPCKFCFFNFFPWELQDSEIVWGWKVCVFDKWNIVMLDEKKYDAMNQQSCLKIDNQ